MKPDIAVRIANRNDIEGIVDLQKRVYPQYYRDTPFFVWQCFENVNQSVLIIARQNTAIVGMLGIQKIQTTNGLFGGQFSWIVVAENKRKSGLFAKMSSLALESFPALDFIFIFANRNALLPCAKTLGIKFIGDGYQLISKNNSADTCTASYLEHIDIRTVFNNIPCSERGISFLKTERYRRWRYANSTVHQYFKLSIPSGEYAIIKIFNEKQSSRIIGDIVDFECNILDIQQIRRLFNAVFFKLKKMGAKIVTTWAVPGSTLRCVLEEMGFSESDPCSSFGINILNEKYDHLYNVNAWHLVQSDATNY